MYTTVYRVQGGNTMYQKTFKLLKAFDIDSINVRARLNSKPLNRIFNIDDESFSREIETFIKQNRLDDETLYMTFNQPKYSEVSSKTIYKDSDIKERRFILIDLDPERPRGVSSTNEEKQAANDLKDSIKKYLNIIGFKNIIEADSANGYHLLVPLDKGTDAESSKETIKRFLHALSSKFDNELVSVDKTVFNSSRLTKLYGSMANKGGNTDLRPHRYSQIITEEWSRETNSLELVENVITKIFDESSNQSKVEKKKNSTIKPFLYANAKVWVDHYKLPYREKEGDVKGMRLFIFDRCPLKNHSTNSNGSSLQQTEDGKVKFTCLHASHENFTIKDFEKTYPIPNEARQQLSIQSLEDGNNRIFDEFKISNNGVYRYVKEDYVKVFEPIFISEQKRVIESNEIEMKMNYLSDGKWLSRWIKGSDLSVGEFKKLSKYAVPIFPRAEQEMITFLLKQKKEVPVSDMHKQIGWGSTSRFLMSENYDNSNKVSVFEESRLLKLSTNGNYSEWLKMVENHMLGNSGSELAIALGFSSVVVGYLARMNDLPRSLICELLGVSSTGKSTMQQFISSIYSSRGLFDSFNATENSIIEKLNGNFGLAYSLDEWNSNTLQNTTRFLYQLSSGMSRMKLDSNSNIREQAEFSTTILTSSETSIRNTAEGLAGLDVRVLPFKNVRWTRDAKAADAIKRLSNENCGVAAKEFMKKLFKMEHDKLIIETYNLAKVTLEEVLPAHRFKSRLLDQYSMILCGAYLVNLVLDIVLDEDAIIKHLIDSYLLITENIVENSVDYVDVLTKVYSRSKNALKAGDAVYDKQLAMKGRYITTGETIKIQYFTTEFKRDLLYEIDDVSVDEAIGDIYKLGLFNHEKGRRTKRIRIDGIQYTVYEFEIGLNKAKDISRPKVANAITTIKDDIDEL